MFRINFRASLLLLNLICSTSSAIAAEALPLTFHFVEDPNAAKPGADRANFERRIVPKLANYLDA
jgi:hypothetical protein